MIKSIFIFHVHHIRMNWTLYNFKKVILHKCIEFLKLMLCEYKKSRRESNIKHDEVPHAVNLTNQNNEIFWVLFTRRFVSLFIYLISKKSYIIYTRYFEPLTWYVLIIICLIFIFHKKSWLFLAVLREVEVYYTIHIHYTLIIHQIDFLFKIRHFNIWIWFDLRQLNLNWKT